MKTAFVAGAAAPRRRFRRWLLGGLSLVLLFSVASGAALYRYLRPYYLHALTYDLSKMEDFHVTTVFLDRHGEEIGRIFVEDRKLMTHAQVPDLMRRAIVAAEDRRFYSHRGIDPRAVLRAMRANLQRRAFSQGGSTLTQQLAKHLIGNSSKTIDRKVLEAMVAFRIERHFRKQEILDCYLNRVYFGKGYFGIGAAAHGYFAKSPMELDLAECALLAGLVKAPTSRSPRHDPEKAIEFRNSVVSKMREQNFITASAARIATSASLRLAPATAAGVSGGVRSYFMAVAEGELAQALNLKDENDIPQGLLVNTTLDLRDQRAAEVATLKRLLEIETRLATQSTEEAHTERGRLQAASLVMDLHTGAVRVMVGGRDYQESPFNRATMSRRENGALLQPFLYALAFERLKLHPASMIMASFLDSNTPARPEEIAIGDPNRDLAKRFLTIQDALAFANKACATRVGVLLGARPFTSWLSSAGVTSIDPETAAGFKPLSLSEVTSLYQLLGNGGVRMSPYTIESVLNAREELVYQADHGHGQPLLDPTASRQMTLTLRAVTREGLAEGLSNDYAFPAPVVGMTGYSEGYRDAWFVGYTPGCVAGTWVGFDQSIPIGSKALATHSALPLWNDIMQKVLETDLKGGEFPIPPGLTKVEVNRRTGALRGVGLMTPAPGDILVYLNQSQIHAISHAQQVTDSPSGEADWASWLSTMMSPSEQELSAGDAEKPASENPIPRMAEYHIPGLRGDILTADGQVLATTIQTHDMVLRWPSLEIARDEEAAMRWASKQLELAGAWLERRVELSDSELRAHYRFQRFHPITIAEMLSPAQVGAFPESELARAGFSLQGVPRRAYPQGRLFAHGIGYLKRLQGTKRLRPYQADEVIYDRHAGSTGLEEIFDRELTGRDGRLAIVTTPEGFVEKVVIDRPATVGLTVRTTIDSRIQAAVEKSLGSVRAGAVVVLNSINGDVLAMASHPDFSPGSFVPALAPEDWKGLVSAEKNPLFNRACRQRLPPGSAFKVVTSIAAMKAGVFDPARVVDCPGYVVVGNVTYRFPNELQSVSYRAALARSCNTYFINLGLRAGRDALIAAARDLGVGRLTGIILPDESAGLMPDPAFVRANHKRTMGAGDVANSSIGQGDVLVTPLQMANWMALIANEGTLFKPRLVSQLEDASGKIVTSFPQEVLNRVTLPAESLKCLKEGLLAVVEEGTATSAKIPGLVIAAKTGTAQVGSKLEPRQIAWIEGYLPDAKPPCSFAVMIEGDKDQSLHGGSDAGAILAQIFSRSTAKPASAAQLDPSSGPRPPL